MSRVNIAKALVAVILMALTLTGCEKKPIFETQPEPPTIAFQVTHSAVSESIGTTKITVMLSASTDKNVTVHCAFQVQSASATLPMDSVIIIAGKTSTLLEVKIVDDNIDELDETVVLVLHNPTNAILGTPRKHILTIEDNDGMPTIQFVFPSSSGKESISHGVIKLKLSNPSATDVTVQYQISAASTATNGVDFLLGDGLSLITVGSIDAIIPFTVINDTADEPDETIVVVLKSPQNATIGTNNIHTYTIMDDDTTIIEPPKSFKDDFNTNEVIEEAGNMSESRHPNWWLNSGAYFFKKEG